MLVWHTIIAQTILPSPNASLDSPIIAVQPIHPDQIALSQAVLAAQPISTFHFHLANRNQVVALQIGQNSGKTSTKIVVLTK